MPARTAEEIFKLKVILIVFLLKLLPKIEIVGEFYNHVYISEVLSFYVVTIVTGTIDS